MQKRHIFLTGQPGVGKTTLLKAVVNTFKEKQSLSGFYTEEVRNDSGARVGFDVVSLSGTRSPLARIEDNNKAMKRPRVGRYSVYVEDFNRNLSLLMPIKRCYDNLSQKNTIFIDEIGKMELLSNDFKKKVTKLLNSDTIQVIGTLPLKKGSGIPYVENIKQRKDVIVFNVTYENRNSLLQELQKYF